MGQLCLGNDIPMFVTLASYLLNTLSSIKE